MTHAVGLQHSPIRPDWLATHTEEPLLPEQPVVDAHHHLYDRAGTRYLLDEMLRDLDCGHKMTATVHVQARSMYRANGPEAMRPVGETEFVNGIAAMSASGIYGATRLCAGMVGFADLRAGAAVRPVLDAHVAAAGGRFRGIRQGAAWDTDASLLNPAYTTAEDMLDTAEFRAGYAQLAQLGLSFDAWLFFHQVPRLTSLARAFPEIPVVLNHCGGILGIGPYAVEQQEVFSRWKSALRELAGCANVMVKISGLGQRLSGFALDAGPRAPSSIKLAQAWRPWIETCVEIFGPSRCMFGSNFPVDKGCYSYGVGLNAIKRIFAGASESERQDVFWRSATRFYRLPHG